MRRRLSRAKRAIAALADVATFPLALARRVASRRTPHAPRSILVVEIWGLGDVVLAAGALAALRKAHPAARLVLLAKPHAAPLLAGSGLVDEIIPFHFPWTSTTGKYRLARYRIRALVGVLRRLRAERFDLVLDARMDLRSNLLSFVTGARRRVGFDHGGGAGLLTDAVPVGAEDRHRQDDWDALLAHVGVSVADRGPTLRVSPDERAAADATLAAAGVRPSDVVVGIHPGASSGVRRWPLARFAALADALVERRGARIVAFAGPDENDGAWPSRHAVIGVRPDMRGMMALLERCDVVVCNDSGPMHVAAALDVPVVAVFGPQRPEWFAPRGARHEVVVQDGFACRPCFDVCVLAEPYCLTTIDVERVYAAVERRLETARREPKVGEPRAAAAESLATAGRLARVEALVEARGDGRAATGRATRS